MERVTKHQKLEDDSVEFVEFVERNRYDLCLKKYEFLASKGSGVAMVYLALNYLRGGLTLKQDESCCKTWLKKACKKNVAYAIYLMADKFVKYKERDSWFRRAWELKDPFVMGLCYYNGRVVKQNDEKAYLHFVEAANCNNKSSPFVDEACIYAGNCNRFQRGVPDFDYEKTLQYFEKVGKLCVFSNVYFYFFDRQEEEEM